METMEYSKQKFEIDDGGFLRNLFPWNEHIACVLAEKLGVEELTEGKMDIIKVMRQYYLEFKSFPILGVVCKNLDRSKNCVKEEFVDPLIAWKIAGLPNPGEEVIAYV
ncbi:MAG: TusE/DsrC/DsvC family sulfur relay protein [Candidatus Magnetoovum sp. WYHC-5]|nr:TusE/DsrC/DsvC family sulfur relay protein [Candidatus Magnetoovum sp. WYHC-5]